MIEAIVGWAKKYCNRRMLIIMCLGFSSGLPIALVGGTLQAWFKTSGASIVLLGFMTLLSQPYAYKFLWSPLLDKFAPLSMFDRRRGWILLMQSCIIVLIMLMSMNNPYTIINIFGQDIPVLLILGFLLSICSATQDIAIDAFRVEILRHDERGLGSALAIEGYRIAMIASGGVALMLADKYGWRATYMCMSGLMLIGVIATLFAPTAWIPHKELGKQNLLMILGKSFKDLIIRPKAIGLILLILTYKLGDAFSHALSTTFLLDLNFSLTEAGLINKTLGVFATLLGVFIGGAFMTRIGLFKSLITFGILAAITNLTYMYLALIGKNFAIACIAVLIENICAGMGTAAFVALLMGICNPNFTASQYALLSSLASFGAIYVGPVSGYMVDSFGWAPFYAFSALAALPGLSLLILLRKNVTAYDKDFAKQVLSSEDTIIEEQDFVPKEMPQT